MMTVDSCLRQRHGLTAENRLWLLLLGRKEGGCRTSDPVQVCHTSQLNEAGATHGDPLAQVADSRVLQQGGKDQHERRSQVDVDGLDVGDLGQGSVRAGHEGRHGEDGGDTECDTSGRRVPMQPEGDPAYDDDEGCRDVDLDQIVAHAASKLDLTYQT